MRRAGGGRINAYAILFNPRLQTGTAELGQALMKEGIEAFAGIGALGDQNHLISMFRRFGATAGVAEFSRFDGEGKTVLGRR